MTADTPTPDWCICHVAYTGRDLYDPACRHDEIADRAAEIERLQAALEHVVDAGSYVDAVMIAEGALSDDR